MKTNETRKAGNVTVTRSRVLGTACYVYTAWEPSSATGHGTVTTIDGAWHGEIGSRRAPEAALALPVGPARWAALDADRAAQYAEAHAAIVAAFPEAAEGTRENGRISVWS
jgi:hypothetical protein